MHKDFRNQFICIYLQIDKPLKSLCIHLYRAYIFLPIRSFSAEQCEHCNFIHQRWHINDTITDKFKVTKDKCLEGVQVF